MKLLITTQVYENYAWNEDGSIGTGADAYWKAKGGSEYVVKNIDVNRASEFAEAAKPLAEQDNDYFRETVIDWMVVEDNFLTEFEQNQLEFEGIVRFPAVELEVELEEV